MTRSDRGLRCAPCEAGHWCDGARQLPCAGLPSRCLGLAGCAAGFDKGGCGTCAAGSYEVKRDLPTAVQLREQNASGVIIECAPCGDRRRISLGLFWALLGCLFFFMVFDCSSTFSYLSCFRNGQNALRHLFFRHKLLLIIVSRHYYFLSLIYAASALPYPKMFREILQVAANGSPIPVGPECTGFDPTGGSWSFVDGWFFRLMLPLIGGAIFFVYDVYQHKGMWMCSCGELISDDFGACSCKKTREVWVCECGNDVQLSGVSNVTCENKSARGHPIAAPQNIQRIAKEINDSIQTGEEMRRQLSLDPMSLQVVSSPPPPPPSGRPGGKSLTLCKRLGPLLCAMWRRMKSNAPLGSPHHYKGSQLFFLTWLGFTLNNFLPWAAKSIPCTKLPNGDEVVFYDETIKCSTRTFNEPIRITSIIFIACYAVGFLYYFVAPLLPELCGKRCDFCITTRQKNKQYSVTPPGIVAGMLIICALQAVQFFSSFVVVGTSNTVAQAVSVGLVAMVCAEVAVTFVAGYFFWDTNNINAPFSSSGERYLYFFQLCVLLITFAVGVRCATGGSGDAAGSYCDAITNMGLKRDLEITLIFLNGLFFLLAFVLAGRLLSPCCFDKCCKGWDHDENDKNGEGESWTSGCRQQQGLRSPG